MRNMASVLFFFIAFSVSSSVQASLIGDEVNIFRGSNTQIFYDENKIVGAGIEVNDDLPTLFNLDITADSLVFTAVASFLFQDLESTEGFFIWAFSDLNWTNTPGTIVDLTFVNWDTLGLDTNRVFFDDDSVIIDINLFGEETQNGFFVAGDTWTIGLVTSHVPIPGAVWLFGSALIGLVGMRRKRPTVTT